MLHIFLRYINLLLSTTLHSSWMYSYLDLSWSIYSQLYACSSFKTTFKGHKYSWKVTRSYIFSSFFTFFTKWDMIFKKVAVKYLTFQFTSRLRLSCLTQNVPASSSFCNIWLERLASRSITHLIFPFPIGIGSRF